MFNGLSAKRKTRKQDVSYWLKLQAFDVIPNGYVTTTYIFKVLNEANTAVDLPLFLPTQLVKTAVSTSQRNSKSATGRVTSKLSASG